MFCNFASSNTMISLYNHSYSFLDNMNSAQQYLLPSRAPCALYLNGNASNISGAGKVG